MTDDQRQHLSALIERLGGLAAATRSLGWRDSRRLRRCLREHPPMPIDPAVLARLEVAADARRT